MPNLPPPVNSQSPLAERLRYICQFGLRAPSVHNSQPWQLQVQGNQLYIYLHREHLLGPGDPTGREAWISLGCLVENLLLAAPAAGLKLASLAQQSHNLSRPAATLTFETAQVKPDARLLEAIWRRSSDRSVYRKQPIEAAKLDKLASAWNSQTAKVFIVTDPAVIAQVADLTSRGITMALSSPAFRHELSGLINHNFSRRQRGIPGYSLELSAARSLLEKRLVRQGVGIKRQATKEHRAMQSASALALVCTQGDTDKFWFEAGQAYERVAATAAGLGLSQATSAAVVEAADFHLDVEKALGTKFRLQAVLRLGYGRHAARPQLTPRISLAKALIT